MAQGRQQNNGSRQRCAQSAAAKAPAEPPKAVCAQLEQMNRKLAAASAEFCAIRPVCLPVNGRWPRCGRKMPSWKRPVSRRGRRLSARALMQSSYVRSWPAMRKLCGLCRLRHIRPRSRNHRQRRVRGRSRRPNSPGRRLRSLLSRTGSPRPDWSTSRWS